MAWVSHLWGSKATHSSLGLSFGSEAHPPTPSCCLPVAAQVESNESTMDWVISLDLGEHLPPSRQAAVLGLGLAA